MPPPSPVATASAAPSSPASVAPAPAPATVLLLLPGPAQLTFKGVALPGATAPVSLDYIAYEQGRSRVWVPVGDTGSVVRVHQPGRWHHHGLLLPDLRRCAIVQSYAPVV